MPLWSAQQAQDGPAEEPLSAGAGRSEEGAGPRPQPFRTARSDTPSQYHSAFTDHQMILGSPGPAKSRPRC